LEVEEEVEEMPPSTVLQMPPAPSSSKSGLVLGVCCDQLMAVQPVHPVHPGQRASGAAASKSRAPDWGNHKAKHLEGTAPTSKWIPPFFIILASLLEVSTYIAIAPRWAPNVTAF